MSTTNVDFVLVKKPAAAQLVGTAVVAPPYVQAYDHQSSLVVAQRVPGGQATDVLGSNNGNILIDGFYDQAFAKNGCFHVTTSGTTPVTISLLNLAANATSQAGDAVFASWNKLRMFNAGTGVMTIGPAASNGAPILNGTTPTVNVQPGAFVDLTDAAGIALSGTTCNLTLTPTTGGDFAMGVGGS